MVRVITFKVSEDFYEKYLKDVENRSEFIRYAILSLYNQSLKREYETIIDIVNDVSRWRLIVWKPLEPEARGRYLTYEIYTNHKYKVLQRYIYAENLRKIYDVIRNTIEELVLNYHRDSEKFRKKVISLEI